MASAPSVVYVSLAPGSLPDGTGASIRDRATASRVIAPIVSGGFDPVAVEGGAGDTLDVAVQNGTAPGPSYEIVVFAKARPSVVRTSPPDNKRDVSLNGLIVAIFSEPMDSASLAGAVTLSGDGGVQIPGTVVIPPNGGDILQVTFIPDAPLSPLTTYVLQVGTGARDRDGEALDAPVTAEFTTNALPPDLTAPLVTILSPVAGDSQAADYPSLRVAISEDRVITGTSWLLDDSSGGPPLEGGVYSDGQDGGSAETRDGMYNLYSPVPPGTYTVRVTAYDGAENAGSSAPVTVTFVTPDTRPRIVVRAFSVVEFEAVPGSEQWLYAPQLVVADVPGQSGLEIIGFELLTLPGLTPPNSTYPRLWARSLIIPPGKDIPLFHELYGDYGAAFGGFGSGGSRRSSGGDASARLTYRDETGHYYATTIQGAIVPGTQPGTYTGGCSHWFGVGRYPGDLSYCGWSGDSGRLGDGHTIASDVLAK